MMAKKQRRVYSDKELSALMKRIRQICGEDTRVVLKTVKNGSKLLGTIADDDDDFDDDSEPDLDYKNPDFEKKYPKLQGRKKELNKPIYFG